MTHSLESTSTCAAANMQQTLVIGVGSPHAMDRVGWEVIDRLGAYPEMTTRASLRKATVPHNALDWFDAAQTTHIVDAIIADTDQPLRFAITRNPHGELCATVAQDSGRAQVCEFPRLRSNSTHQFDLLSVLQLAAVLGTLPRSLALWAIPIRISEVEATCQTAQTQTQAQGECLLELCVQRIFESVIERSAYRTSGRACSWRDASHRDSDSA